MTSVQMMLAINNTMTRATTRDMMAMYRISCQKCMMSSITWCHRSLVGKAEGCCTCAAFVTRIAQLVQCVHANVDTYGFKGRVTVWVLSWKNYCELGFQKKKPKNVMHEQATWCSGLTHLSSRLVVTVTWMYVAGKCKKQTLDRKTPCLERQALSTALLTATFPADTRSLPAITVSTTHRLRRELLQRASISFQKGDSHLKGCRLGETVKVCDITQIIYHMKGKTTRCWSASTKLFGKASIEKLSFEVGVFPCGL